MTVGAVFADRGQYTIVSVMTPLVLVVAVEIPQTVVIPAQVG